jgi:hypothetical protein
MAANQTVNIYGKVAPRPIQFKETKHDRVIYGLDYPLGKNKSIGGFFSKSSGAYMIRASVQQLLGTERGERILLPKYGCNLRKFLFQPLDENTFEAIKNEVLYSFKRYIVGATVKKISVVPAGVNGPSGGNSLFVTLILQLDEDELAVFDVGVLIK